MRRFVSKKGKMTMEQKKTTNYDVIKEMSIEEMAAVFYLFIKPLLDCFEMTEEQRKEVKKGIMESLNQEVGEIKKEEQNTEK